MARIFTIVVGMAAIVGAFFTGLQYFSPTAVRERPEQPEAVTKPGTRIPGVPPSVDLTPDPTTAAQTKVVLRSLGPALGQVAYSVTNLGWADNMRNVSYSLWAVVNGRLKKIDQRQASFVAKGQYVAAENLRAPFRIGKMVVCVSYEFKRQRVSVIDFYTNEGTTTFQRQIGEMVKFRESLSQVNGSNDLCESMPAPAARLI